MIEIAGGVVLAALALVLVLCFWRVALGAALMGGSVVVIGILAVVYIKASELKQEQEADRLARVANDARECKVGELDPYWKVIITACPKK